MPGLSIEGERTSEEEPHLILCPWTSLQTIPRLAALRAVFAAAGDMGLYLEWFKFTVPAFLTPAIGLLISVVLTAVLL